MVLGTQVIGSGPILSAAMSSTSWTRLAVEAAPVGELRDWSMCPGSVLSVTKLQSPDDSGRRSSPDPC
jgi:hypothetical protein